MLIALLVLGGAIGAPARYLVDGVVQSRSRGVFPWGTFVVNVSGSFVLGLLVGVFAHRLGVPLWLQAAATVGFLGAYTTFSTFSFETLRLAEGGLPRAGLRNIVLNTGGGLLAAGAGLALAAL